MRAEMDARRLDAASAATTLERQSDLLTHIALLDAAL
jgi:hypothetical protein